MIHRRKHKTYPKKIITYELIFTTRAGSWCFDRNAVMLEVYTVSTRC